VDARRDIDLKSDCRTGPRVFARVLVALTLLGLTTHRIQHRVTILDLLDGSRLFRSFNLACCCAYLATTYSRLRLKRLSSVY